MPEIGIVLVFGLIFLLNLWGDYKQNKTLKALTKPLLMPLIIVYYLYTAPTINVLILSALFMGFLGDTLLLGTGKYTIYGAIAFLIGHLFYITAFLQTTSYFETVPASYWLFIVPYIIYGILAVKTLNCYIKSLFVPAIVYLCAILMMSFCALCRLSLGFDLSSLLPLAGSLLFILSDSALAWNTFAVPDKNYEVFIMLTYVIAQISIVAGFIL